MSTVFALDGGPLRIADVVRAAQEPLRVEVSDGVREIMRRARAVVDRHMAEEIPVYGLNTGLGGNIGHRIPQADIPTFQEQMVRGRVAGVGDALPVETCRAALFCRIVGLAKGGAGISPHVFDLLVAMLERDVVPVIPSRGSIGAGDLIVLMSMAAVVIGRGEAYHRGRIVSGAEALAAAGLAPVQLGAKDGLAIANASSVTTAMAALALEASRHNLLVHLAAASLSLEGYGANPRIFDPRLAAARPAAQQGATAVAFAQALIGSSLHDGKRPVQDAISFRALAQVTGTVLNAYEAACDAVEVELNGAADNPLVLPDDGEIHSAANFHTPAIALAFDTLAIAMAHLATASAQRSIKLMTGRLTGLPNYLTPVGGASAGFVPMQKALAALQAEIRLKAMPASLDALAVSDTVEDIAPQTPLTIIKFEEQTRLLGWVLAMEAMFAAQAVSLRQQADPARRLGPVGQELQAVIRAEVPALENDRETGPDAAMVRDILFRPSMIGRLEQFFMNELPVLGR